MASKYQSYTNGGYSASLNLTVTNHKDIKAEIVIELSSYGGDNLKFDWQTTGLNIEKVNVNLQRITRVFAPNEKFSFLWNEDYRV